MRSRNAEGRSASYALKVSMSGKPQHPGLYLWSPSPPTLSTCNTRKGSGQCWGSGQHGGGQSCIVACGDNVEGTWPQEWPDRGQLKGTCGEGEDECPGEILQPPPFTDRPPWVSPGWPGPTLGVVGPVTCLTQGAAEPGASSLERVTHSPRPGRGQGPPKSSALRGPRGQRCCPPDATMPGRAGGAHSPCQGQLGAERAGGWPGLALASGGSRAAGG